ncbi:hypothetical protein R3P38DRAFT_2907085 [Favolaschia claudopus]|uniref:Uncharacterized protein n=1 Tax=Favolaschia claudopus TaxID=2862362 RepID=A0AAW0CDC9_9AGAR
MAQVLAPMPIPSVATLHPALPVNLINAFKLNSALPQGGVIDVQSVEEANAFTDDVVQSASDRAHMLSKIHAETTFNDPNTLQNILASLRRLEAAQARVEARLDNAVIVKRNAMHMKNNTGATIYTARQKQVSGDGVALIGLLMPAGVANVHMPAAPPHLNVGGVQTATINPWSLGHQQILDHVRFYNEDFGIVLADLVPARQQKMANWLTQSV